LAFSHPGDANIAVPKLNGGKGAGKIGPGHQMARVLVVILPMMGGRLGRRAVAVDFLGTDEGLADEDGIAHGVAADGAAENGLRIDKNYEVIRILLHVNALGRDGVRGHRRKVLSKEGIGFGWGIGCA
jgi:hypothetical protein